MCVDTNFLKRPFVARQRPIWRRNLHKDTSMERDQFNQLEDKEDGSKTARNGPDL